MEVAPAYKIDLARELRRQQTPTEALLWPHLRAGQIDGLKFRRQHPIGRFVAAFCCESALLIVEIDGGYHETEQQRVFDAEREAHFLGRGYTILRFSNEEVTASPRNIARRIAEVARERLALAAKEE